MGDELKCLPSLSLWKMTDQTVVELSVTSDGDAPAGF